MLIDLKNYPHPAYCYTGGKTFDARLPSAVFIHGAQSDHSVWSLQTRYFAHHGFGVLAVDLPGHARGKGAPLRSIEAMADWMLALLDAAGVTEASFIGHSMGSLIALECARRAPTRVTKLALVGTAYPMKVGEVLLNAARDDVDAAIDMVNIWSHAGVVPHPGPAGSGSHLHGVGKRLMQKVAARSPQDSVMLNDLSACNAYGGGEQAAAALRCPTLFLLGQHDMMTTVRASVGLQKSVPHAQVVVLKHCGHQIMTERPDEALDTLFEFATKVG